MGRTANPENARKIAETKALIDGGMKPKDAIKQTGIKKETYRSWCDRQRNREADQRAWARLGKQPPAKHKNGFLK